MFESKSRFWRSSMADCATESSQLLPSLKSTALIFSLMLNMMFILLHFNFDPTIRSPSFPDQSDFGEYIILKSQDKRCTDSIPAHLARNLTNSWSHFGPGLPLQMTTESRPGPVLDEDFWPTDSDISVGSIALPIAQAQKMHLLPGASFPWDDSKQIYIVNAYHNLHCLVRFTNTFLTHHYAASTSSFRD